MKNESVLDSVDAMSEDTLQEWVETYSDDYDREDLKKRNIKKNIFDVYLTCYRAKLTCDEIVEMFFKASKVRKLRKLSIIVNKLLRAVGLKDAKESNETKKNDIKTWFGELDWTPLVDSRTPSATSSPSIGTWLTSLSNIT